VENPSHPARRTQQRCGETGAEACRQPGLAGRVTREHWLSLSLLENTLPVFEAGGLRTVEAVGSVVVGIPKSADGHHLLGTAPSYEEAVVVATILRLFNPN